MALTTKKVAAAKKVARPPNKPQNPEADPLRLFPGLSVQLQQTYDAQLRAFLHKFVFVRLAPAVRRSISAAVTAQGGPVSVDFRITFYPPDASGFLRANGELITPVAALAPEGERDEQSDDPEYGPQFTGLFGEHVRMRRPKGGWRKSGRRR
jgi:hypothetical protein